MHWTYELCEHDSDLHQGDILEPSPELRSLLADVHPHFLAPKYTAFLLLTQSCDMVLRSEACNTRYLCIGVVRPLEAILHELFSSVCCPIGHGFYTKETKPNARDLLGRLFNQNEQSLGLFYLHPEAEAGIATPSVAMLRVAVTLRVEHYRKVQNSRSGRLNSDFRSKLGWLVGNTYSRVATPDWSSPAKRKKELDKMVNRWVKSTDLTTPPEWIPEAWMEAVEAAGVSVDGLSREDLKVAIEQYKPDPARVRIIEHALRVVQDVVAIDDGTADQIRSRLDNDKRFSEAVKAARRG